MRCFRKGGKPSQGGETPQLARAPRGGDSRQRSASVREGAKLTLTAHHGCQAWEIGEVQIRKYSLVHPTADTCWKLLASTSLFLYKKWPF